MNLRILKKLSKRAAPMLRLLGDRRGQFKAVREENYTGQAGHDRKHWDRNFARSPMGLSDTIYITPKHGKHHIALREPYHPLRGTVMVGETTGYYEPEWDESTAWEALADTVFWESVSDEWIDSDTPEKAFLRLRNPARIFAIAEKLMTAKALEE